MLPAIVLAPAHGRADATDDGYAVAAGLYARKQWDLAADEFRKFAAQHPQHPKASRAVFYQAEALVQAGKLDEAHAAYRRFLELDPEGASADQAQFRLGETAHFLGRGDDAVQALADFVQRYPDSPLLAFALPYLGELRLQAGQLDEAAAHFNQALERFPKGQMLDDARYGLARVHQLAGRDDEAQGLLKPLAASQGRLADDAAFQLAVIDYEAGRYPEAAAALAQFLTKFPESPLVARARLALGFSLYHQGDAGSSADHFRSLAGHSELGLEAGYWLGLALKAQQKWQESAAQLAALDPGPEHHLAAAISFHAGDACRRAGRRADAARHFDDVLNRWPDGTWAQQSLLGHIQLAADAGQHADVIARADEYRRRFPQGDHLGDVLRHCARAHLAQKRFDQVAPLLAPLFAGDEPAAQDRYLLALAEHGLGRHEQALSTLDSLLASGAGELTPDAQYARGVALLALGRYEEAVAPFEAYLAGRPEGDSVAAARARLALCAAKTGQFDAARGHYQALLALAPPSELLAPAALGLAETLLEAEQYEWALELFSDLSAGPDGALHPAALSGLAWCRYRTDRLREAAEAFAALVERFPGDQRAPAAALTRGAALERLEELDPALVAYQRVAERYPASPQAPLALLAAARIHDRLAQHREAERLYRRLWDDYPSLPQRDALLYDWAWALRDAGQLDESLARFDQLHREFRDSSLWPDATYRLAEHAYHSRDFDAARQRLAVLLAQPVAGELLQHALYLSGQVESAAGDWQAALAPLTRLSQEFPDSPLRLLADFQRAEANYQLKHYEDAGAQLAELAQQTQGRQEPWIARASLRQAQVLAHQKRWDQCRALAERFATEFPDFDEQFEVDYVLGRALVAQADLEAARAAFRKVIESPRGARTETAAMAQFMIGETYLHQKDYRAAIREYLSVEILYAYPDWQAAALLEAGKCYQLLAQPAQAAELYARLVNTYPETPYTAKGQALLDGLRGPAGQSN